MKSVYLREQKRYTWDELLGPEIFNCSAGDTAELINMLQTYGIVKKVRATEEQKNLTDLLSDDIAYGIAGTGDDSYYYVFTFVGVVIVRQYVLRCYPKYLFSAESPKEEFRQVIKVLEKHASKRENLTLFDESGSDRTFHILGIMLYLLQDYFENGIYCKSEETFEINGQGEIIWDKTINETFMFLSGGRPYYLDLLTRKYTADIYDFFKCLHECILTKISDEFREAELLDLFDLPEVHLSDHDLTDFGDVDYILYRIENELNVQFNTRKQFLLKAMYAYVDEKGNLSRSDGISVFGTSAFHKVWEDVCSDILGNQLYEDLQTLHLPKPLNTNEYSSESNLFGIIEKPKWTFADQTASKSLEPDTVTISNEDNVWRFIIYDAKYYTPTLIKGKTPVNVPGIESVTKQYLYQLAYKKFAEEQGIYEDMINCFLFPTENNEVLDRKEVSLEILHGLNLQNIQVRFLPAGKAFDLYLSGNKLNITELKL